MKVVMYASKTLLQQTWQTEVDLLLNQESNSESKLQELLENKERNSLHHSIDDDIKRQREHLKGAHESLKQSLFKLCLLNTSPTEGDAVYVEFNTKDV